MEAAYYGLLVQSLSRKRAVEVVSSGIRYADVKPVNAPQMAQGALPPASVETLSARDLGIEAQEFMEL
ncbi:hypothetical protein Hdeb2414_s0006g00201361 [Helianthus debilis subsp. tardiflorus]